MHELYCCSHVDKTMVYESVLVWNVLEGFFIAKVFFVLWAAAVTLASLAQVWVLGFWYSRHTTAWKDLWHSWKTHTIKAQLKTCYCIVKPVIVYCSHMATYKNTINTYKYFIYIYTFCFLYAISACSILNKVCNFVLLALLMFITSLW